MPLLLDQWVHDDTCSQVQRSTPVNSYFYFDTIKIICIRIDWICYMWKPDMNVFYIIQTVGLLSKVLASLMRNYFPKRPSGASFHTLSKIIWCSRCFCHTPSLFLGCVLIAVFAVDEWWLLLDIRWFVLFFFFFWFIPSLPEMRIRSRLLIKFDLKWRIHVHLSRSLVLYSNETWREATPQCLLPG